MEIIRSYKLEPKAMFTSRYRGVIFHKGTKKWRAAISVDGTKRIIGYYDSERLPVEAYNSAAQLLGRPYNVIED